MIKRLVQGETATKQPNQDSVLQSLRLQAKLYHYCDENFKNHKNKIICKNSKTYWLYYGP